MLNFLSILLSVSCPLRFTSQLLFDITATSLKWPTCPYGDWMPSGCIATVHLWLPIGQYFALSRNTISKQNDKKVILPVEWLDRSLLRIATVSDIAEYPFFEPLLCWHASTSSQAKPGSILTNTPLLPALMICSVTVKITLLYLVALSMNQVIDNQLRAA